MTIMLCNAIIDKGGSTEFPVPAYGSVRLWIEGDPPIPTDWWILIGDYESTVSLTLKTIVSKDVLTLDSKIKAILDRAKVTLEDFGLDKKKVFHMDIHVPRELIDGYAK